MVDRDAFLFNPFLSGNVNVYKLTPASDCVRTQPVGSDWSKVLADALGESSVRLIPVGNGDEIQGFWEMWNLGGNVLTLAPGLVVCYDRNKITLDLLDKAGIEVRTFEERSCRAAVEAPAVCRCPSSERPSNLTEPMPAWLL